MTRPVLALLLLLAALVGADVGLTSCEGETRAARNRVRQLFPAERREVKLVRALRLAPADGRPAVYALRGDLWRCLSFRDAVCDGTAIENLVRKLVDGTGIVESTARSRAEELGFEGFSRVTVTVAGEDGEWGSFDVGDALPRGGGTYVRLSDGHELIAFDRDLRAGLENPAGRRFPPFVDRTLVTGAWFDRHGGIATVRVAPAVGTRWSLERRRTPATPEDIGQGQQTADWWVVRDGRADERADPALAASYLSFVREAHWIDIAESSKANPADFEVPPAELTIVPHAGDPLVLTVASREVGTAPDTASLILNPFSGSVCAVASRAVPLLVPASERLLPGATNVWTPDETPK